MDKEILMHKVLLGEASETERRDLHAWIANNPQAADEFEDLKLFYGQTGGGGEAATDDEFYEPLKQIQASLKQLKKRQRLLKVSITMGTTVVISCFIWMVGMYTFGNPQTSGVGNEKESIAIPLSATLNFKDTPLHTVFQVIGEGNDLVFTSDGKERWTCRFTGTFAKGISLEEVLSVLAEAENFQYAFTADHVLLTGKGCTNN